MLTRKDIRATGDDVTSKAIVLDLYYPCHFLMESTNYVYKSSVPKKFVKTIKRATDEEIAKWDNVITGNLKSSYRPFLFELLRFSREELLDMNISSHCINEVSRVLESYGYHLDTKFSECDLKKLFMALSYVGRPDFDIKLSLEDDEIHDSSKKRILK